MFKDKLRSCKQLLLIQNTAMTNILEKRFVFRRLNEIIKSNPGLQVYNIFWDYYFHTYIDSQVMELMRILDKDDGSKNINNLIDSLIKGSQDDPLFFEGIKKSIVTPVSIPLFNADELINDKEYLSGSFSSVNSYRDWKVAHNEPQKWEGLDLDLTKLDECIDFLHQKILDYELKLNGVGFPRGLLPLLNYDWESIFRIPWVK